MFFAVLLLTIPIINNLEKKPGILSREGANQAATFRKHKESHQLIQTNPGADTLDAPALLKTTLSANT